ncbi:DUF998 domain-containing protein [Thalassococcus sp. BH17M4-6]|uniref:DUF998 domain-containing protein n=1 Tax=Thalassococcus sp. BH17M4-6 TaxID=3413148 RepID=UPI003BE037EA
MDNCDDRPCDPHLMRGAGIIAILGAIALIAGNVVGSILVPGHDWVADTVSDLAAGRYEIIQDVTLYCYAGSLLALAIAAAHAHPGKRAWNFVILGLALLALCVTIIAVRNEYGDGDNEGVVIHIYVVYAMGVLFTAVFALAGLVGQHLGLTRVSWVCAALWGIGAPVFFLLPTAYDGAFERFLGVVTTVWVCCFGWQLIRSPGRVQTSR